LWPEPVFVEAVRALLDVHLTSFVAARSPIKPLIALAERAVFAFALPGNAMLLYLPSGNATARCSDRDEEPLLRALAADPSDHATRIVYADLLEQRGQLARAEYLRAEAAGENFERKLARVESLFHDAGCVFLPREHLNIEMWPVTATEEPPPTGRLLQGDKTFSLAAVTGLSFSKGNVEVHDLRARPTFEPQATLTFADGTWWLRMRQYHSANVNQRYWGGDIDLPLFDGDVIEIGYDGGAVTFRL
jgi:uncharacterized protein (TIGR02996 family)